MIDFSLLPPGARIEHEDLVIGGCSVTDLAVEYGTPALAVRRERPDELLAREVGLRRPGPW